MYFDELPEEAQPTWIAHSGNFSFIIRQNEDGTFGALYYHIDDTQEFLLCWHERKFKHARNICLRKAMYVLN